MKRPTMTGRVAHPVSSVCYTQAVGAALRVPFRGVRNSRRLQCPYNVARVSALLSPLRRYYGQGDLHFITTSCYRRRPLLGTARSRDIFLKSLEQIRRQYRFDVIGFVIMPEHVHLLLSEPEKGNPSVVMQALKLKCCAAVAAQTQKAIVCPDGSLDESNQTRQILAAAIL